MASGSGLYRRGKARHRGRRNAGEEVMKQNELCRSKEEAKKSNISRDVAMATNFVAKLWQNYLPILHLSETEWYNATSLSALTV